MTIRGGRAAIAATFVLLGAVSGVPAVADVVTRLPTGDKVVALTFDACEGPAAPAVFDRKITDFLVDRKIPFTVFVTGRFARRNAEQLAVLSRLPFVEVENHSFDHPQHMERLDSVGVRAQVEDTDRLVEGITGRRPRFFRFPAGSYDAATLATVEATGHRVVHWSFESGDPARGMTPEHLRDWVVSKTKPGNILIFHVNGRAPATGEALPAMVAELERRGIRFVRLDEILK